MLWFKLLSLVGGKLGFINIWDVLLLKRRNFASGEDIYVPAGMVLQMHSPIIDSELKIDGEVYIL